MDFEASTSASATTTAATATATADDDAKTSFQVACFVNSLSNPNVERFANPILQLTWTIDNSGEDPCQCCRKPIKFGAFNKFDEYLCEDCYNRERDPEKDPTYDDPCHFRVLLDDLKEGKRFVDPAKMLEFLTVIRETTSAKYTHLKQVYFEPPECVYLSLSEVFKTKRMAKFATRDKTQFEPQKFYNLLAHDCFYAETSETNERLFVFRRNQELYRKIKQSKIAGFVYSIIGDDLFVSGGLYVKFQMADETHLYSWFQNMSVEQALGCKWSKQQIRRIDQTPSLITFWF